MSKVQINKKNLFEEVLSDRTNYYSYNTLVAVLKDGIRHDMSTLYLTTEKFSVTTSRHVNFLKQNLTYNSVRPLSELV
jgi:hypothetical protein